MDAEGQRASFARTTDAFANGEVVWSWPPDAEVKLRGDVPRDDGGKKARSPGRARISRKATAQGRPDDSAFTCGSFPVLFHCTGAAGAAGTRPSLRPPIARADDEAELGRQRRREEADLCQEIRVTRWSSSAKADDPVRRGFSAKLRRLWNTGSPGRAGRRRLTNLRLFEMLNPKMSCASASVARVYAPLALRSFPERCPGFAAGPAGAAPAPWRGGGHKGSRPRRRARRDGRHNGQPRLPRPRP